MKYKNIFNLEGKVAVVTGGAGLIGEELVRGLAEFGAVTVIADVDKTKGSRLAKKLGKNYKNVFFRYLDITNERSVSLLIDFLGKKYKHIDIWINNAYPRTRDWGARLESVSTRSWKKNVDMHLNGYFICCRKIAEFMKKQGRGSIINFGSIYGVTGPDFSIYEGTSMTLPAAYSAIKGGIINFTRYLASHYGKYNVRVNCVSPGGVYNGQAKAFVKKYSARTPLKRLALPGDIVGGVIYLASDAGKYVTGHNLLIDGGWTAV